MTAFHRALLRIRPEPLAAAVKTLLRISRREVETPRGRFFVDPVSNFGARVLSNDGYEPRETEKIINLTRNAKTFVDVGANEGYFAVIAARNMGPIGRVLAIEPQQRLLPVLLKNMSLNQLSFEIATCAVTDNETSADMFFSTSINSGTTGFVRATAYPRPRRKVRTARLETILAEAKMPIVDCMKMDIEGLEYEAIFGSKRLFETRSVKHLLIEFHPNQIRHRGNDPTDLIKFLKSCGYYSIDDVVWSAE